MRICRLRGGGAECSARPRASGLDDSAEGIGFGVDGSGQGSDVDEDVPSVSATQEEAYWAIIFGQRVLRGTVVGCDMIRKYVRYQEEKRSSWNSFNFVRLTGCGTTRRPASFGAGLVPLWGID